MFVWSWSFGRFMSGDRKEESIPGNLNSMCKSIERKRKIRNMLLNILCKFYLQGLVY